MSGPRILLIVGGGIAAYKACELVRMIGRGGGDVTCVLTAGGAQFVTAMSLAALSGNPVHTTLWDLRNETEMGHIELSREADLVVVCPATADLMAKMACGIADDLATTLLLATDKPVMAVPAMNVRMWEHAATTRNVATLRDAGVLVVEPDEGPMACGEYGPGRLPEPDTIWARIEALFTGPHALPIKPRIDPRWHLPDPEGEGDDEDDDGGGPSLFGLGGLTGAIIPRSFEPRPASDEDIVFEDVAGVEGELSFDEQFIADTEHYAVPVEVPTPGLKPATAKAGGGPLATKGRARAAPPTDPQAVNHTLAGTRQAAPEPIEGDNFGVRVDGVLALDSLAGQPDFAEEPAHRPLYGKHVLITAGPTHEPIDPVRYIANRSSGRQGFAIAAAAAAAGARVTLVSGPVALPTPPGVERVDVETAIEMAAAVKAALPADCAIMVAAVADWRTREASPGKLKKRGAAPPVLQLTENPDILATLAGQPNKPALIVGFAAETSNLLANAQEKRARKGADWIVANDVSGGIGKSVMGGTMNRVHILSAEGIEELPEMPKDMVAAALVERIARALA